ncbi:hypothetical protein [Pseudofrankia sp. DC12]|uniref:hypothetical protein n=1 Tax=Pseudofrankia sp. DC12 TaxID=683315 RepID=UPI0005F83C8C|nr:hypothetical protein [Pseudofrankia sp. DC12]
MAVTPAGDEPLVVPPVEEPVDRDDQVATPAASDTGVHGVDPIEADPIEATASAPLDSPSGTEYAPGGSHVDEPAADDLIADPPGGTTDAGATARPLIGGQSQPNRSCV